MIQRARQARVQLRRLSFACLILAFGGVHAQAQETVAPAHVAGLPAWTDVAGHVGIDGRSIDYRVVAGEIALTFDRGQAAATMFSTAYLRDGKAQDNDAGTRPVVFLFNGGPGGASVGMHTTFGPRRIAAAPADGGRQVTSTVNAHTLLDVADLVFVDPVGTGYSRLLQDDAKANVWGVEQDAANTASFVRSWLSRMGREDAPVFLVGQSYAGVRVVLAAEQLVSAAGHPVQVRGLVLVSPSTTGKGEAVVPAQADVDRLPVYAATAWFHGHRPADNDLDALVRQAEAFASGAYRQALLQPDDAGLQQQVADRLQALTGIDATTWRSRDLSIDVDTFANLLLASRGERIGTLDTRAHALRSITDTRSPPYNDPSTSPYTLDFDLTEAWEHYFRNEVGYRPASGYVRLSMQAHSAWDWTWRRDRVEDSTTPVLASLLRHDRRMRVLVAVGYYDLAVPYRNPVRAFESAGLPSSRFRITTYPAGHAVHADRDSANVAIDDLRAFIRDDLETASR